MSNIAPKTLQLVRGGLIGAAYAAFTLVLPFLSYGPIQLRFSEALCVLPFLFPESVWGLFAGCALANGIGFALGLTGPWDILFGSLATLAGALLTRRTRVKWLAPLPPVLANALIIGPMLAFMFTEANAWPTVIPLNMLCVGAGELAACYGLGLPLLLVLQRLYGRRHPDHHLE